MILTQRAGQHILTQDEGVEIGALERRFVPDDVPQAEADTLIWLYNHTGGDSWTDKTNWKTDPVVGNWYGITVAGGHVTQIKLNANNLNGDVGAWSVGAFTALIKLYLYSNAALVGDLAGWTLPAPLTTLSLGNTGLGGDISSWTLPVLLSGLSVYNTVLLGVPDISSNTAMWLYYYYNCGLSQANVNAVCQSVYERRMAFTNAAPRLNIGGTNAVPSGAYADEDPPVTGQGYIYELCNDPEAEGFNKWQITYRANGGDVTKP